MNKAFKSVLRRLAGIILLLLGFAGLFLPGLQGILMIAGGLLILFPEDTVMGRKLRRWLKEKRSRLHNQLEKKKMERETT